MSASGNPQVSAATDIFISAPVNRSSHAADWNSIQVSKSATEGESSSSSNSTTSVSVLAYASNRSIAVAYDIGVSAALEEGLTNAQ